MFADTLSNTGFYGKDCMTSGKYTSVRVLRLDCSILQSVAYGKDRPRKTRQTTSGSGNRWLVADVPIRLHVAARAAFGRAELKVGLGKGSIWKPAKAHARGISPHTRRFVCQHPENPTRLQAIGNFRRRYFVYDESKSLRQQQLARNTTESQGRSNHPSTFEAFHQSMQ